jgi:O-antigen/teichoic acid export membrane protein
VLRSVATVMRGTVFAQVVGVAVLPLLTRLFDPQAFEISSFINQYLQLL